MENKEFCHLHVHNEFSYLDGYGSAEQYVLRAKELGFDCLGLTNHGNIDGLIKFQKACLEHGIKPILGCELYLVSDLSKIKGEKRKGHVVVLVKNEIGWSNLCKMMTFANTKGFYYKPLIDYENFLPHLDGLIILTGCAASFLNLPNGISFFEKILEKTNDVYLEIMPHNVDFQKKFNLKLYELKKLYNLNKGIDIPIVASNDCHYVNSDEEEVQEVLLAVQKKQKWSDPKRFKFEVGELYLKTANEMLRSFRKQGVLPIEVCIDALKRTKEVAEKCDFRIGNFKTYLPKPLEVENEFKFLKEYCYEKLSSRNLKRRIYEKRLDHELKVIKDLGFVRYFLIVKDIIDFCKKEDIMVGPGRGSVSGSLIAYLLDITKIDPIRFDLMFSRFISPKRLDLPDIDLDIQSTKRNKVLGYLENKYGKDNVLGISTFLKMKNRMVFRDICRVFDVPLSLVNYLSNKINDDLEAFFSDKEVNNLLKKYPKIQYFCKKLVNQVRGVGQHAAGVVLVDDIYKYGNVARRQSGFVINWDKEDIKYLGLLKLDILALSALDVLQEIKKLVKTNKGINLKFENIPLDDKKVLDEFSSGNTIGVFQFSSQGMTDLCKQVDVDKFDLIPMVIALYRPAPLRSGMPDLFLKNRFNQDKCFDEILEDTYGVLIFQEQVLKFLIGKASFSFTEADEVRKALVDESIKDLDNAKLKFIQGCLKNGISENEAELNWNTLMKYGGYAFNKAHATGYGLLAYWFMYCKVYYPIEYICSQLTLGNVDKKEMLKEALRLGLKVALPKVGYSKAKAWEIKDNILFMPFIEVKGIGDTMAKKAEKMKGRIRNGFYEMPKNLSEKLNSIKAFDDEFIFLEDLKDFEDLLSL